MPNPKNDADQHRFAQIRSRMLDGLIKSLPDVFVESSGAKSREEFRDKLCNSTLILSIIDVCAYESQTMEEEMSRGRHP